MNKTSLDISIKEYLQKLQTKLILIEENIYILKELKKKKKRIIK